MSSPIAHAAHTAMTSNVIPAITAALRCEIFSVSNIVINNTSFVK